MEIAAKVRPRQAYLLRPSFMSEVEDSSFGIGPALLWTLGLGLGVFWGALEPGTETPESSRDSLVLPMMVLRGVLVGCWRWVWSAVAGWLVDSDSDSVVGGGGGEGLFMEESG